MQNQIVGRGVRQIVGRRVRQIVGRGVRQIVGRGSVADNEEESEADSGIASGEEEASGTEVEGRSQIDTGREVVGELWVSEAGLEASDNNLDVRVRK